MRLHLPSLPHTITAPRWSTCAFSQKVLRFPQMMQSVGYEVIHYGVEGAETGATEQVDVLTRERWLELGGREPDGRQYGDLINTESPLYRDFNRALAAELIQRVKADDVICLPFGSIHNQALAALDAVITPRVARLETGIGYPTGFAEHRVYESYAWMHYHLGAMGTPSGQGNDYWWVIPNSYDPEEWPVGDGSGNYLLYFGRLNADKGMNIVWEIAKARPDLRVVLCGQGDASPWATLPNIDVRPPLHGEGRAQLLGGASAVLMPTRYIEPFGGVAVESFFVGTPVVGSDWGAFAETIKPGENGYRCRTLREWLMAVDSAPSLNRQMIRDDAERRFSMWSVAFQYDRVFRQLADLRGKGWYA